MISQVIIRELSKLYQKFSPQQIIENNVFKKEGDKLPQVVNRISKVLKSFEKVEKYVLQQNNLSKTLKQQ